MRTVILATRHADLARFEAPLAQAGFAVKPLAPDRLAEGEPAERADAVLLDVRDTSPSTSASLAAACAERDVVVVALVPEEDLDRVTADLAVDDFALVTVGGPELVRRIARALWRRHGIDSENGVHCGALMLDLSNYRVTVEGETLVLTFKEYELLRFLAMNAGRVFTREQLLNRVWGYDYFGGARTVDVHIRRIRSKIEIRGHSFIETVRNVGYRLVADARKENPEP
ncbi:MAG: response regulator transcription factor [Dehalococcoidia bacterium]|nr:response regulator transcription factor [Dehalococcoidia bacterium]